MSLDPQLWQRLEAHGLTCEHLDTRLEAPDEQSLRSHRGA